jgi:hypothetical protein
MRRAAAVPGLVLVLALGAGCSGSDDDDAAPRDDAGTASATTDEAATATTTAPTSDPGPGRPTPVDVPEEVSDVATESADDYVEVVGDVLADPSGDALEDAPLAGVALEAVRAQAEEFERSGWHTRGRPEVLSIEVYESSDDEMVIGACIDDSGVDVLDQKGDVVRDGSGRRPTLNIFTLSRRDSGWVVVGTTFPPDPDC